MTISSQNPMLRQHDGHDATLMDKGLWGSDAYNGNGPNGRYDQTTKSYAFDEAAEIVRGAIEDGDIGEKRGGLLGTGLFGTRSATEEELQSLGAHSDYLAYLEMAFGGDGYVNSAHPTNPEFNDGLPYGPTSMSGETLFNQIESAKRSRENGDLYVEGTEPEDGELSREDLQIVLGQLDTVGEKTREDGFNPEANPGPMPVPIAEALTQLEANWDDLGLGHTVTREELVEIASRSMAADGLVGGDDRFASLDTDGDGRLTAGEL